MRCYHPIAAFQSADGSVKFAERAGGGGPVRSLFLRCGQCIGCRLDRSCQWACRVVNEASLHEQKFFLTLTYKPECLPVGGSLVYRDFQLFMKRLRKHFRGSKIRFFMAGEYGPGLGRPHFHACVFGCGFEDDKVRLRKVSSGWLYRSPTLESLWKLGYSSFGEVTFESAAYVARYVCDKVSGEEAVGWYQRLDKVTGEVTALVPEFCHMSLKPGIGADWMRLYWAEVAQAGKVVLQGREVRAPKFYERMMKRLLAYEDIEFQRAVQARELIGENSDERLAVQEVVSKARLSLRSRGNL